MKIAIISSVYEKTPPLRYGGIERVLDFLVKGLKTKGHDVTLFATGDSSSPCNLVHFFDHPVVPYEPNAQIIHSQKHADISMNITLTSCIIMWIFQLV